MAFALYLLTLAAVLEVKFTRPRGTFSFRARVTISLVKRFFYAYVYQRFNKYLAKFYVHLNRKKERERRTKFTLSTI